MSCKGQLDPLTRIPIEHLCDMLKACFPSSEPATNGKTLEETPREVWDTIGVRSVHVFSLGVAVPVAALTEQCFVHHGNIPEILDNIDDTVLCECFGCGGTRFLDACLSCITRLHCWRGVNQSYRSAFNHPWS